MSRFRNVLFGLTLAVASMAGAPMRMEEVEELMQAMNQPKIAHVLREVDLREDPWEDFVRSMPAGALSNEDDVPPQAID